MVFVNRTEAGRKLALKLKRYKSEQTVIIALPRGGVVVGYELARLLVLPLRVLIVRKLGSPLNPEFAIGAVASGGVSYLDQLSIQSLNILRRDIEFVVKEEMKEIVRREDLYGTYQKLDDLQGKTIILVDDGLATGSTAHVAVLRLKKQRPKKIILAVPGSPTDTWEDMKGLVNACYALTVEDHLNAVGALYKDFPQVSNQEALKLLARQEILVKNIK